MVATLADGPPPAPYASRDWADPSADAFRVAAAAVRGAARRREHAAQAVGAGRVAGARRDGSPQRGIEPVWSAGRGEEAIVRDCDPDGRYRSYAGVLDLPQLWRLLRERRAAGRARHRRRASGARRLGAHGGAVRAGLGGDQRRGRILARRAVSRGDRRSVSLPRPAAYCSSARSHGCAAAVADIAECPQPRCMEAIDLALCCAAIVELGVAAA